MIVKFRQSLRIYWFLSCMNQLKYIQIVYKATMCFWKKSLILYVVAMINLPRFLIIIINLICFVCCAVVFFLYLITMQLYRSLLFCFSYFLRANSLATRHHSSKNRFKNVTSYKVKPNIWGFMTDTTLYLWKVKTYELCCFQINKIMTL